MQLSSERRTRDKAVAAVLAMAGGTAWDILLFLAGMVLWSLMAFLALHRRMIRLVERNQTIEWGDATQCRQTIVRRRRMSGLELGVTSDAVIIPGRVNRMDRAGRSPPTPLAGRQESQQEDGSSGSHYYDQPALHAVGPLVVLERHPGGLLFPRRLADHAHVATSR